MTLKKAVSVLFLLLHSQLNWRRTRGRIRLLYCIRLHIRCLVRPRSGHPPFRNKPSRLPLLPSGADGLSWRNGPELPIAMPPARTRLQLEVDICACRSMRWSTLFEVRNFGRSRHHLLDSCIRWNGPNVLHSQWSVTAPDNNVAIGLLAVIVPGDGSDGFVRQCEYTGSRTSQSRRTACVDGPCIARHF
ncbi:hypothetical protein PhaeoP10_02583 [Phaeobacter inhibens]|nr:hypothetical protein PhaeoP10_02583 [Phaeobacter inhibens]